MTSPKALGTALARAPDPELARVTLTRLEEKPAAREALERPEILEPAVLLLGFSGAVADFLIAHPEEAVLFADVAPRARHELLSEAEAAISEHGGEGGLRRFRRRAIYRLAARDLQGATFEEVVEEVTAIAESCLELALAQCHAEGLAVIGMGKLGGAELNYSSDVDLILVHPDRGGDAQERAARTAGQVLRLLSEATAEGVALRVDLGLRPEGRSGVISRSYASTVEYYRRHAATWEKQALLKARPVAGDTGLGARLLEELVPVVYPEHLEPSAIEDVRHMKVRIEEYVRARGKEAVEVKTGRGGIRDVEFAVQLLQLVHGRRDPRLRETNTLRALGILGEEGYVGATDAEALADSYRFLRTLEHRLQLVGDRQVHELPEDEVSLRRLARSLRLAGAAELREAYSAQTQEVRRLHDRLFYRPLLETFTGPRAPRPGSEEVATKELLEGLGFADPDGAHAAFLRLVDPSTRMGKVLEHVFPIVAPALALSPSPNAALARFEHVCERLRDQPESFEALASDPAIARRMARAVGASSWLSDLLGRIPPSVLADEPGADADPGASVETLLLRAGAAYAAGELTIPASGRALASVADRTIVQAVEAAAPSLPLAFIGMGKLGAEELNFASDLDVVFVYEGEGAAAFEEAKRAAEAVLAHIRDAGYEADADLRPEGRSGPLARSLAAYLEYWGRWGQTWEFQALIKARPVAGDELLGRRFVSAAEDFAYPEYLSVERVAEIRKMRVRMERERVRPPDAGRFHFKLGFGGLADITFAVELQQLRYGRQHEAVRRGHTLEALEALAEANLVEDTVALALGEAYVFLGEVKNALEIDQRVRAEAIPPSPEGQLALARRLGYEEYPRQSFLEDYRRVTRRARRSMERVFYGEEPD